TKDIRYYEKQQFKQDLLHICDADNASLASIHSEVEDFIAQKIATDFNISPYVDYGYSFSPALIGLIYDDSIHNWTWSDGTEYNYSNFLTLDLVENINESNICGVYVAPSTTRWEINDYGWQTYLCHKGLYSTTIAICKKPRIKVYHKEDYEQYMSDFNLTTSTITSSTTTVSFTSTTTSGQTSTTNKEEKTNKDNQSSELSSTTTVSFNTTISGQTSTINSTNKDKEEKTNEDNQSSELSSSTNFQSSSGTTTSQILTSNNSKFLGRRAFGAQIAP
uniref:C-type lectin domain-containing protein n=1 Tax=Acrobeloides nanus TaxID=290746 RepID=A0A914EGA4_9BILA